jgi:PhzF family phenazine biosynthesis protein
LDLPFFQIDAFATKPFEGNQAGVMPLSAWLDDATLQGIANENNVAETAFTIPHDGPEADFHLRWFTPAVEVALCGHATLAAGYQALAADPSLQRVRFMTRWSGVLEVARDSGSGSGAGSDRLTLDLPAWPSRVVDKPAYAAALGTSVEAIYETIDAAEPSLMAILASADAVRACKPDFRALAALGGVLAIVTAPGDGGHDVISRVFAPAAGIDEDPVTGSAHAMLTPYWAGQLGRDSFVARQASARGGTVHCRLVGNRVILGGTCVTTIEGVFRI